MKKNLKINYDKKLLKFYDTAYKFSLKNYNEDIEWIKNLKTSEITAEKFFSEYIWVVLCSGFRVKEAKKIFDRLMINFDINHIKHPLKRKAISIGLKNYKTWFKKIEEIKSDEIKLEFLETLPHIGKITKYHLGKNIGLNIAKPDVHLTRLANKYGYSDVQLMCESIGQNFGHKKNLVDQVLWRFCEQNTEYLDF